MLGPVWTKVLSKCEWVRTLRSMPCWAVVDDGAVVNRVRLLWWPFVAHWRRLMLLCDGGMTHGERVSGSWLRYMQIG